MVPYDLFSRCNSIVQNVTNMDGMLSHLSQPKTTTLEWQTTYEDDDNDDDNDYGEVFPSSGYHPCPSAHSIPKHQQRQPTSSGAVRLCTLLLPIAVGQIYSVVGRRVVSVLAGATTNIEQNGYIIPRSAPQEHIR